MPKMDTQHLERIGHRWYCVFDVPASLVSLVGRKRLRQALGTDSLAEARQRRHTVLAEFQGVLSDARRGVGRRPRKIEFFDDAGPATTTARAMMWREGIAEAERAGDTETADTFSGLVSEEAERLESAAGYEAARRFAAIANGRETPIGLILAAFMAETAYPQRTKGDVERTTKRLEEWAAARGNTISVETLTKREAGQFVTDALAGGGLQPKTISKAITCLSVLWRFAAGKGYLEAERNPWLGQAKPKPKAHQRDANESERPFTDAEVSALIYGPADPVLSDLMRLAALTGARIEELFRLRVRDCVLLPGAETLFIARGKSASAPRHVPVHSAIVALVIRRCEGKQPSDFLFHEEGSNGPGGERSMAVSKRFGYYRRRMKVDERVPGQRRSLVNFHSFRRWFSTKATHAEQSRDVIADIMGHARQGITMRTYAGDTLAQQKRTCVEAVCLPRPQTE